MGSKIGVAASVLGNKNTIILSKFKTFELNYKAGHNGYLEDN